MNQYSLQNRLEICKYSRRREYQLAGDITSVEEFESLF
jgi:hypothetical protein